jgi:hypothetical protein
MVNEEVRKNRADMHERVRRNTPVEAFWIFDIGNVRGYAIAAARELCSEAPCSQRVRRRRLDDLNYWKRCWRDRINFSKSHGPIPLP